MYDRVTEEGAHKRELEGGAKVQESALGMFKAVKVLFKSFGKVHVRFSDPFQMQETLKQVVGDGEQRRHAQARRAEARLRGLSPHQRRDPRHELRSRVRAAALQAWRVPWIRGELEALLVRVEKDLRDLKIPMTPELEENFPLACKKAIDSLVKDGLSAATRLRSRPSASSST